MEYKVEGYVFTDEETAEKARKEAETIKYIRSRTDFSKPENAKKIIDTIRKNNMFETELGLDFVSKLENFAGIEAEKPIAEQDHSNTGESGQESRDYSQEQPAFSEADETVLREEVYRRTKHIKDSAELSVQRYKDAYKAKARNLYIVIIALVFVIAGLLVLTFLSDNSPFYDAEKAVQDKYATWQEELQTKENYLKSWEEELKEREEKLNSNK